MLFRLLAVSVGACLVWIGGLVYLSNERDVLTEMYLDRQTTALNMAWKAVVKSYQIGMRAYFDGYIMQPRVLELLQAAQGGSEEEQAVQRAGLYRHLYPVYQKLQVGQDVRQLHFHTPDSRSFLRFHAPHYSGDSLQSIRPSVVMANRDLKVVHGLETGRVVAGYRNVFPIINNGVHLGSVEISQPFEAIRREMQQLDNSNEFRLFYKTSLLLPKLFSTEKKLYQPSLFSQDWLVEDPEQVLSDSPPPLSGVALAVCEELRGSFSFQQALSRKDSRTVVHRSQKGLYKVTTLPIVDLKGETSAFLLSFAPAPEIEEVFRLYRQDLAIFSVMVLFGGVAVFLLLQSKQTSAENRRYLRLIADTMNDGLYVTDVQGVMTLTNDMASELLGYDRNELLGKVAHYLFHFHDGMPPGPIEECPIFKVLQSHSSYVGEEVFRRRDGTFFVAEVASEPLFEKGRIIGAVTVFRDISDRKKAEAELKEAHDKFNLLSNTIETQVWSLVAPDTYGAVNHAHAEFCGMSPEAMENRTFHELFSREVAESSAETNQVVFTGYGQVRSEQWVWNARGERRFLSLIKTPKFSADGQVDYVICSGQDITERKQMEEQLLQLSNTDPLTGAFNRRYFLQVLQTELKRSQRYATPFALVMCDIDYFKKVNDVFGHEAGDKVLVEIVACFRQRIRATDVLARWGGEEFVLLLTDTTFMDAVPLVETIRQSMERLDFGEIGVVTVSFGVTANRGNDTDDSLLNRADALLYAAKAAGRNCVKAVE